nr:reverse transcriptase domain-containing protein [Tanacetum cinerariifolium]
ITRVYFVEGLGHNLFSVGQFCDSDLEAAFRRNACVVRNLEGVDLLKGDRSTNLYTINLYEMASASPICLMALASSTKSWLWHQRLSHLNFDTINDLARNDLVADELFLEFFEIKRSNYLSFLYSLDQLRIMERIEERLGQFVDQLTDQMNDLMNNRRPRNRRHEDEDKESEENPFGDGSSSNEQSIVRPRRNPKEDNRHWEYGMRVNIPNFDGDTLNPEGFIDWLAVVEEVFEFKEVPKNKRVSLIATKLRGRASAWWQQMKLTKERVGKSKITSWQKMKKCTRANFIPHNYQRLMYQRLQIMKQGSKSVEDYTTEFYQLIARNDIQEREDQLVSRYIGGLRVQIMDSVNMFDPVTLSDAFQRALAFEKQNRRVGSSSAPAITSVSGSGNAVYHFSPNQAKAGSGNTRQVPKATGSSGLKCFNCGEPGHRQSECKKAWKRHLFADPEDDDDDVAYCDYEAASVYDEEPEYDEEYVFGDIGANLVVRCSCLTPKADGDDWLKHNIFQSTCTILDK